VIWTCWLMPSWHSSSMPVRTFYQLRRLREVRKYVNQQVLRQLVHVLIIIISRLVYCNCIFVGLPKCLILRLQRVQNAAARLIFGLRPRKRVTPALQHLDWHLSTSTNCVCQCTLLLIRVVQPTSATCFSLSPNYIHRYRRWSSTCPTYVVPITRTKLGERTVWVSRPVA